MNRIFGHIYIYSGIVYIWGSVHMMSELYNFSHYNVLYVRHKNYYYKFAIPMVITMIYGIEKIVNGFRMITE
jgi:hypothetical protein